MSTAVIDFPRNYKELNKLKIRELKQYLVSHNIDLTTSEYICVDKSVLINKIIAIQQQKWKQELKQQRISALKKILAHYTTQQKQMCNIDDALFCEKSDYIDAIITLCSVYGQISPKPNNQKPKPQTNRAHTRRDELNQMRMSQLKQILKQHAYATHGFCEKSEYIEAILKCEASQQTSSFPTTYNELNALTSRDLKQYLESKHIDSTNYLEKSHLINAALMIQAQERVPARVAESNHRNDDAKQSDVHSNLIRSQQAFSSMSIVSLAYQLNMKDELEKVYFDICKGMSRLQAIGLLSALNRIIGGPSENESVLTQIDFEYMKENVNTLHLFSFMIINGINIKLVHFNNIYQQNINKYVDVDPMDALRRYVGAHCSGGDYLLRDFDNQQAIIIAYGNEAQKYTVTDQFVDHNHRLLIKQNMKWSIDQRTRFLHDLNVCFMNQIQSKQHRMGIKRDKMDQVILALKQPQLENAHLMDDDYRALRNDFKQYEGALRSPSNSRCVYSVLATAAKAMQQSHRGYRPRNCQIAAVLLYHRRKSKYNGRLLQVGTGEGKSIIVYLIAAIEVLVHRKKVDVITSQFLLAKSGCVEQQDLYEKLGISVTYLDPQNAFEYAIRKNKYSTMDVVYGTSGSFMGDMLRIEEDLRENRKCEMCIVDEVDNAFIDSILQSILLSSPTAGMRSFNLIFMTIWVQLKQAIQGLGDPIVMNNGQLFFRMKHALFVDILAKQLKAIPMEGCTTKLDKIIAFIIFKLNESRMIYDEHFQHQYGFDTVSMKDSSILFIQHLESRIKYMIQNIDGLTQLLTLLSHNKILNCKISLYKLIGDNRVVFKAYFENGKQKNEVGNIDECDFILLQNDEEERIFVLHSIKDQNIEKCVKRQITKLVLRKCGLQYDDEEDSKQDEECMKHVKESQDLIPSFLKPVVKENCKKWVDSAWTALLEKEERRDYVINGNEIKIIDLATGTIQNRMVWSDGLHQFIQLKHDLRLNNMGFSAIMMTKCLFFKQYVKNNGIITGLTGTLGGQSEKRFYQNMLNVDAVNIPSFAQKPLIRYNDILCNNTEEWLDLIALNSYVQAKLKKSVLIVANNIQECNLIISNLENWRKYNLYQTYKGTISRYTRDDNSEQLIIDKEMNSGDIIVATNLAGRGTDIKLSKSVTAHGGLHVVVAFTPENERLLHQNIGRTCRAGRPGSAILIINSETCDYCVGKNDNIESVKLRRQHVADKRMEALEERVNSESAREEYYSRFISLIHDLEARYWHKKDGHTRHGSACCKRYEHDRQRLILSETVKKQIEHKWSLTYPKIKCETSSERSHSNALWNQFKNTITNDLRYHKCNLCYNPFYLNRTALWGDDYNKLSTSKRLDIINKACGELGGDLYVGISFYLKAFIELEHAGEKPSQSQRRSASKYLQKAMCCFGAQQQRCSLWKALYSTVKQTNGVKNGTTDLDRMIEFEMTTFWPSMIETCQECLKNINHTRIEVHLKSVRSFFESKKCVIYERVMSNYIQCGLSHIIIIDKRPPGFWERVGAAFTAILGVAQVIAGMVLVSCSGGVLYSLGQHCIERGVHKAIAGIKGLFSDDWDTAAFWKQELLAEVIGLVAIGVKHFVGPALDKILPSKLTGFFKVGDTMTKKLSANQILFNALKNEAQNIEELNKVLGVGGDVFNLYNNVKKGKVEIKDFTNISAQFIEDEEWKQRVRSGGNLVDTVRSGKYKGAKNIPKLVGDVSNVALTGDARKQVRNWVNVADDFANEKYFTGTAGALTNCGLKEAKYIKLIDGFKETPSIQTAVELICETIEDSIHMNGLSDLIKNMINNKCSFDDICSNLQQLITTIGCENQIVNTTMQFMVLIKSCTKLKTDKSMQNVTNIVQNVTSLVQNIQNDHSHTMTPFEYTLRLYQVTQNLMETKSKANAVQLLQLVANQQVKDPKIKAFISISCIAVNIKTMDNIFDILHQSSNIIFDNQSAMMQGVIATARKMIHINPKQLDLNAVQSVCECIGSIFPSAVPMNDILVILQQDTHSFKARINIIQNTLRFFTANHASLHNEHLKELIHVQNITTNVIHIINKFNDNSTVSVAALHGSLLEIASMFGPYHERELKAMLRLSKRQMDNDLWNHRQTLSQVINVIINKSMDNRAETKQLHRVLSAIQCCGRNVADLKYESVFDIIQQFDRISTYDSAATTIHQVTSQIQSSLKALHQFKKVGAISLDDVYKLLRDLLVHHPSITNAQMNAHIFDIINSIKCLSKTIKSVQRKKKFDISTLIHLCNDVVDVTTGCNPKQLGVTQALNHLKSIINRTKDIVTKPSVASIIHFVQSLSNVVSFKPLSNMSNQTNTFSALCNKQVSIPKINTINERSICDELQPFANALSNNKSFNNGFKAMKRANQTQNKIKQFSAHYGDFETIIRKQISRLIQDRLRCDEQFKYLFCFCKNVDSADGADKQSLTSKIAQHKVHYSAIIRKGNLMKLMRQNISNRQCTVQNVKNFFEHNRKLQQWLQIVVRTFMDEYQKHLSDIHDQVRTKDTKQEWLQQITDHYNESFASYDKQIAGWQENATNIKQVEEIYVNKKELNVNAKDIAPLHAAYGSTGSRFVTKLKEYLVQKHYDMMLNDKRQQILKINIELEDYEAISNLLASAVFATANVVMDDILSRQLNECATDWVDSYNDTTNDFMDAVQMYYKKKIELQMMRDD